jgi:hypothetical protein
MRNLSWISWTVTSFLTKEAEGGWTNKPRKPCDEANVSSQRSDTQALWFHSQRKVS